MKRLFWLDNLRWVTVLLVLLFHVVYFFNNKGVFGGVGGFGEGPQFQDVVMYVLYPWMMPLLFVVAGVSARLALGRGDARGWIGSRTRKLLVPSTVGLFVFQWMTGFFNCRVGGSDALAGVPMPARFALWAVSGTGPLWFVQDLWLFSVLLLLLRRLRLGWLERLWLRAWAAPEAVRLALVAALGALLWLAGLTMAWEPRAESLDGLWNLYRPVFYFVAFALGYGVFWREEVTALLAKWRNWLLAAAAALGVALVWRTFGEDVSSPRYVCSPLNWGFGWMMCLAMLGWFRGCFDRTGRLAGYLTRSSYGVYVVHYLVVASVGFMLRFYSGLPPWAIYLVLAAAVFGLSPVLYEVVRRVPVVCWCVLGEDARGFLSRKEA